MTASLFISYSRADLQETDWLARLKMYLAPFDRTGLVDVWDDGRIASGTIWRDKIAAALNKAAAAVLLVGPGFLASDFIMRHELPKLLSSAEDRGTTLFPLIVAYCGYEATDLEARQAFNSPKFPLESLARADQNRILNDLAIAIGSSLRAKSATVDTDLILPSLYDSVAAIGKLRGDCLVAFKAQCRRRDDLVDSIEKRLGIRNDLQYEKFFFRHHSELTAEERFQFDQIRAMTEGPLQSCNRKILGTIESDSRLLSIFPEMTPLRQHLVFWLNKFDLVFTGNRAMCLLYTGVEDGVPFPNDFDDAIETWLLNNKPSRS